MIRSNAFVRLFVCVSLFFFIGFTTAQQVPENTYQDLRWRMIGPFRGGRTRAAAGVPSQPNVFYMAQVNGGVWKSDDYGRIWAPIFDHESTQSIGSIAVAPSNPNIIYVGSGEGLHRPDLSVGNGIYKSTDAGKTWTHLGLRDGLQIPALAIDPRDPNKIFAAVLGHPYGPNEERGVFRSTDGGQTWQKVIYKDENTGASEVEIDPSNPDIIYASMWEAREGPWEDGNMVNGTGGGLFKSTDGGNTWRPLTNGLPKDLSQINIAIAPSDPHRIYATMAIASGPLAFYRSDDAGESWSKVTDDPRPSGRIGGGDLAVPRVDSKNPDIVYCASTVTMKSTDGGKTWSGFRGAPGGDDYQNLWINPNDPNTILLVSDQGALVTVNGGASWSSWYNQPTAQIYHVAVTPTFPYKVCGGQQESGSVCISSRGNDGAITFREWHPVGVIEYGYVAPDPLDPDVIYGGGRTEVSKFHWSTGQVQNITPIPLRSSKFRADRSEPTMFSPIDPHTLYYASNVLFKTTDGGNSWQTISSDLTRENPGIPASVGTLIPKGADKQHGVIYSLAPSFKNINTLWAGTDDGLIWQTRDGGKKWNDITPKELTPWSKVTQIAASHFDDDSAYASVSRFRINDLQPYIYRTHDGGKTWKLITTGLPAFGPVDTVREDHVRKGLLFAGTENSVWVSFDDGDHWQPLQLNLPHTSMRDLWIHDNDLIVATHGRGFWILDDIAPLREAADLAAAAAHLFTPAPAYRVQRDTNTDTPLPPDEPAAANPPDGAIVDYYLAHSVSTAVTLEILDARGKLVHKFSSADKPEATEAELKKQLIPLYWLRPFHTLSTESGMHRWVWDLHYSAPDSPRHEYPIAAIPADTPRYPLGPTALPGSYTARLTANGKSYTAPFMVKMDPRGTIASAGLEKKFQLEVRLASLLTQTSGALLQAGSMREPLQKLTQQATGPTLDAIQAFQNKLAAILGASAGSAAPAPDAVTLARVNGQFGVLYGQVWQVDAEPTVAQIEGSVAAEHDASDAMQRWNTLMTSDLPALNGALRSAKLPEIKIESDPHKEETLMDEE
ncbi:MAG TPA: glycoside hydrolase [Candidatus Dormibacteraeota bacterium]|nr:glycoside hydrolase [Candidatus Dormibacteraeota bacterium]